ncbi:hypothetical protein ACQY0O_005943 [Thecaphora frezii]
MMPSISKQPVSKAGPAPTADPSARTPTDARSLTAESLQVLHRFLSFADPAAADLLPIDAEQHSRHNRPNKGTSREVAIADWNVLYSSAPASNPDGKVAQPTAGDVSQPFTPTLTVRSHPDPNRNLFSVQSVIPGVSARQFWSLMATAENRRLWDSTVEEGAVHRWLAQELEQDPSDGASQLQSIAEATAVRVELFRFGSIFMVAKARDMVLLSVDARLPPLQGPPTPEAPLRLVSTSCSVVDPSLPPRKGYTRFPLKIGGFMVEDLGDDGLSEELVATEQTGPKKGLRALAKRGASTASNSTRPSPDGLGADGGAGAYRYRDPRGPAVLVTQVSDLGEMAAWVPASVVKMVASTLVPRSIASIGKVTKTMQVHRVLYEAAQADPDQGKRVRPDWNLREKLSSGGGEWYVHRPLPVMIGTGCLCWSNAASTMGGSDEDEGETGKDAGDDGTALDDPMHPDPIHPDPTSAPVEGNTEAAVDEEAVAPSLAQESVAPPPPLILPAFATPLPRNSSLPGTPAVASHAALPITSTQATDPMASPSKNKPGLSIDLLGLNMPSFRAAGPISPYVPGRSPGMYTDSDAGIDDMMSSMSSISTPGRMAGKFGRRFDPGFSISPSEGGTETVPGSVAASELEDWGIGDYLSKGRRARDFNLSKQLYALTNEPLRRSNLILTPDSVEQDRGEAIEELEADSTAEATSPRPDGSRTRPDVTPKDFTSETLPYAGSFSPADSYRERALSLSPATKTANLISQELLDQHGAKELDRRVRRMSRALLAEVEKRHRWQRSGSGHGSSASESIPPIGSLRTHGEPNRPSENSERLEPKEDIIDLLAEALNQSLPITQILEEAGREADDRTSDPSRDRKQAQLMLATARSVSAMLLTGSDAFAMALAPAARESLALGFDGLSTASDASEPPTPSVEGMSPSSSMVGSSKASSRLGSGLLRFPPGPDARQPGYSARYSPIRTRKPSVNSVSRSISVSNAFARPDIVTTVTHAISQSYVSSASTIYSNGDDSSPADNRLADSLFSLAARSGHASRLSNDTMTSQSDAAATEDRRAVEKLKALKAKQVATRRSVHHQRVASRLGGSVVHRKSNSALRPGAYAMVSGLLGMAWSGRAAADVGDASAVAAAAAPESSQPDPQADRVANGATAEAAVGASPRVLMPTQEQAAVDKPATPPRSSYFLAAAPSGMAARPRIPAQGSIGRLKSRQNYRLDLNSKLHPFPGSASLGQSQGKKLPPIHASDEQAKRAQQIMARSSRYRAPDDAEGNGGDNEEDEEWEEENDENIPPPAPPPAPVEAKPQQDKAARGWLRGYWSSAPATTVPACQGSAATSSKVSA